MKIDKKFIQYFKNLKQVFLYLSDECNLSCKQCLYKPNLIYKKKLSPNNALRLLDICRDLGAFKLTILGGECTLYDTNSLIQIIQHAKKIGYKYVRIDTNGVFDKILFKSKLFSLLDEISFEAPDMQKKEIIIDAKDVEEKLNEIIEDEDLSRYIL